MTHCVRLPTERTRNHVARTACAPQARADQTRLFSRKNRWQNRRFGQVFWLPDHSTSYTFPRDDTHCRRFSQWLFAAFVPGYSGGTATDLHRIPYSSTKATSLGRHPCRRGDVNDAEADVNDDDYTIRDAVRMDRQPRQHATPHGV